MKAHRDERWLDGELRRAIHTSRPEFDAAAWKRKHAGAYAALTSHGRRRAEDGVGTGRRGRLVAGMLAAAAVIFICVATLLLPRPPQDGREPVDGTGTRAASPASAISMMALRKAYRQGGQEALNRQLDAALETLGPRPDTSLLTDLLTDLRG